jgi:hypothetical protein
MKGVNPGSYVLSAKTLSQDGQMGFLTIKVADIDYIRGDLVVGPGVTVNARLFGNAPPTVDMRATQVSLLPVEPFIPAPRPAFIQPNGVIAVANVQPGDYLLSVSGLPEDAYVKAARSAERDILERFVPVQYESRDQLDIQIAFDGGQINGTTVEAAGQAFSLGTVVLVPDKTRRHRPDQYRVVTSEVDGKFSIRGIPPGDYKIFAWESVEPNAYINPDFILNFEELGVIATVRPGEKLLAQVRVIPDQR